MRGQNAGDPQAAHHQPVARLQAGNDRTVAAAEIAEAVKQTVATFTEVHHQYHFMYFNNLDGPLPAQADPVAEGPVRRARRAAPGLHAADDSVAVLPADHDDLRAAVDVHGPGRHTTIRTFEAELAATRTSNLPFQHAASQRGGPGAAAVGRRRPDLRRQADRRSARRARRSAGVDDRPYPIHSRRAGRSRPTIRPRTSSGCRTRWRCRTTRSSRARRA